MFYSSQHIRLPAIILPNEHRDAFGEVDHYRFSADAAKLADADVGKFHDSSPLKPCIQTQGHSHSIGEPISNKKATELPNLPRVTG
jgi:hypothetical protein